MRCWFSLSNWHRVHRVFECKYFCMKFSFHSVGFKLAPYVCLSGSTVAQALNSLSTKYHIYTLETTTAFINKPGAIIYVTCQFYHLCIFSVGWMGGWWVWNLLLGPVLQLCKLINTCIQESYYLLFYSCLDIKPFNHSKWQLERCYQD